MRDKTLVLIDGNSLMYRAFYALPLLSNNQGIYTNAVYGFLNMMLRLVDEQKPTHLCVAFDAYGPTFRHEVYEEYKGKRQKTPEELIPQFELIREILKLMNVICYEQTKIEADDIIGTLSKQADDSISTLIVTGDKDSFQLIDKKTTVLFTRKGISNIERYTPDTLNEQYGLNTEQFIDLKALMGDSSDNIPGVPGVGEKTGLKLLHEYQSLTGVYENIDKIKGKLKEKLEDNRDLAFLSRELATINRDVEMDVTIDDLVFSVEYDEQLANKLKSLGLNKLVQRLQIESTVSKEQAKEIKFQPTMINFDSQDVLEEMIEKIQKAEVVAIQIDEMLSFSVDENEVYCVKTVSDLMHQGLTIDAVLNGTKNIFQSAAIQKIVHDQHNITDFLAQFGINVEGIARDTAIGAYLLDATRSSYKLSDLVEKYIGLITDNVNSAHLFVLSNEIDSCIKENEMSELYLELEMPLSEVLRKMEHNGFRIDQNVLQTLDDQFSQQIKKVSTEILTHAGHGFNINSPQQLSVVLFDELGLPPSKKTKSGFSTSIEVLEGLVGIHPIIPAIITYRQLAKLKATYVDGLSDKINHTDGKIHTRFLQTMTATGRISSVEPNLQNIPIRTEEGRKIRKAFIASEGNVLIDADYSQIELRVLAHISKDENFTQAFINDQDIHRQTASEILNIPMEEVTSEQRSMAKAVNFGIVYGISDYGLSRNLGITRKEAKTYIDGYFERYPAIKEYMDQSVEEAKKDGYVKTLLGRRRSLPEIHSRNYNTRMFGERIAMNMPIQGTAADIIKVAMVRVGKRLEEEKMQTKLILQVHDELILDAPLNEEEKAKQLLKEEMQKALTLSVPLKVDIELGNSWYETK